jgi:2-iminobutanoate/2-iminopropanoate deaminase
MIKKISTQDAPAAIGPYSQAIAAGDLLFVSGQLPIDPQTNTLHEGDIGKATHQSIDNLIAILKANDMTLNDVVRTDVFLRDMNDFQAMNEAYAQRFTSSTPPARQTIQAARLPKHACVEISCIAYKKK